MSVAKGPLYAFSWTIRRFAVPLPRDECFPRTPPPIPDQLDRLFAVRISGLGPAYRHSRKKRKMGFPRSDHARRVLRSSLDARVADVPVSSGTVLPAILSTLPSLRSGAAGRRSSVGRPSPCRFPCPVAQNAPRTGSATAAPRTPASSAVSRRLGSVPPPALCCRRESAAARHPSSENALTCPSKKASVVSAGNART